MDVFWKTAVSVVGVGAVTSFVMWSLYREWIRLDVWQRMTKRQQFLLFVLFLSFTFFFALAGLASFTFIQLNSPADTSEAVEVLRSRNREAKRQLSQMEGLDPEIKSEVADALSNVDRKASALEAGKFVYANEIDNRLDEQLKTLRGRLERVDRVQEESGNVEKAGVQGVLPKLRMMIARIENMCAT